MPIFPIRSASSSSIIRLIQMNRFFFFSFFSTSLGRDAQDRGHGLRGLLGILDLLGIGEEGILFYGKGQQVPVAVPDIAAVRFRFSVIGKRRCRLKSEG